ncbi:MAG: 50S ribosomal protein L29 [Armatimonadetes bacterium]|nr:50S ribosomal protein L29 [Armatimonadota bacterium]
MEQLRESSDDELIERMTHIRESLLNLRFRQASGQVDDPKRVRKYRKAIARINTVLHERRLGIVEQPARSRQATGEAQ